MSYRNGWRAAFNPGACSRERTAVNHVSTCRPRNSGGLRITTQHKLLESGLQQNLAPCRIGESRTSQTEHLVHPGHVREFECSAVRL